MATLRKRNGKWQVQIRRTGCSPITKTFIFKSDADAWTRYMESDLDKQSIPTDKKQLAKTTLAELLKRYLNEITPLKREVENESYKIKNLMRSDIASLRLIQIAPQTIANHRDKRLRQIQPASVRRELDLLGHVFEVARKEWLMPISINPVAVIKKPAPPEARKRRLLKEERTKLLNECGKLKNQSMSKLVSFALETGMRRGEITALLWENVNFDASTIYLPMTKNGSSRTVPLTPKAYDILVSLSPKEQGNVFNLTNVAVRQTWDRLVTRAAIKDLHFHDLRHEAISRFFEMGLSVPEVALISGHKDMRMLFRYTHLKAENVADKLAGITSA